MKAQVVQRHSGQCRFVLKSELGRYYLVTCRKGSDMSAGELISGDFDLREVCWFLNLTRAKLVGVVQVTPFATLDAALGSSDSSGRHRAYTVESNLSSRALRA